jgi:putative acetyltransferase
MMVNNLLIRDETIHDVAVISAVTEAAFQSLEISDHTEQFVVDALRSAGALTLSLVAEAEGRVVGHIAFSPVIFSDGTKNWYGLGPVSVLPEFQRMGIGKTLILTGLTRLKDLDAKGCCLVGHPLYYRKFGFENVAGLTLEGVPPEVFFALSFDGAIPQGTVLFHQAFMVGGEETNAGDANEAHTQNSGLV